MKKDKKGNIVNAVEKKFESKLTPKLSNSKVATKIVGKSDKTHHSSDENSGIYLCF